MADWFDQNTRRGVRNPGDEGGGEDPGTADPGTGSPAPGRAPRQGTGPIVATPSPTTPNPAAITEAVARARIAKAYHDYYGREATAAEITLALKDKWQTEGDLQALIIKLANTEEARGYQTKLGEASNHATVDPMGHDYILGIVQREALRQGANPSMKTDPEYWVKRIQQTGGLRVTGADANLEYWRGLFLRPEGAPEGGDPTTTTLPAGLTNGSLLTPWTEQFTPGPETQLPPAFDYPDWTRSFEAPTEITEQNDPGFQARLKMGQQALERSAAAKGTLLTGGTAKAIDQYGQDFASNEYANVFDRALTGYKSDQADYLNNKGLALEKYGSQYGTANDMYNRARSQYDLSRSIFEGNQDRPFNKLFSLTNLGANTASGLNTNTLGYAGLYSNGISDYIRQLFAGLR